MDDDLPAGTVMLTPAQLDKLLDNIGDLQEPRCPECHGVLHPAGSGYQCRGCRLVYLVHVDPPRP